ncbi:hypothetical protein [Puniceibacterium sediminis]|uniref:Uncharacterized protein n=1 Tax=Puniceibacterium sediminis TaxID=1608407 RepID=A0A238Y3P4_9RHOB|nr:hypothetical protein [Puniceibacterium sediminis]SNR65448.1 hypothetical protein SAMN06265370_11477 [Puniceibacterium sediminis]
MIRPGAKRELRRWRDALAGAAVLLVGLYWGFFTGGGLLHWMGYAVALGGLAVAFAGIQRARFRQGEGGPGVVEINERRISYFGPLTGGVVDLDDLDALSLDQGEKPPHWVLVQSGQPPLHIPLTATGAEALFDAFATLPGIRTEQMLRRMSETGRDVVVIWRSAARVNSVRRLH